MPGTDLLQRPAPAGDAMPDSLAPELASYRFRLPQGWEAERLLCDPPLQAILAQPEEGVSLQIEVLPGMANEELFEQYVQMLRLAGFSEPFRPRELPVALHTALRQLPGPGSRAPHHQLEVCVFEQDLLAVGLTWPNSEGDVERLRRVAEPLLADALAERLRRKQEGQP
jgi:hypothetical protein